MQFHIKEFDPEALLVLKFKSVIQLIPGSDDLESNIVIPPATGSVRIPIKHILRHVKFHTRMIFEKCLPAEVRFTNGYSWVRIGEFIFFNTTIYVINSSDHFIKKENRGPVQLTVCRDFYKRLRKELIKN